MIPFALGTLLARLRRVAQRRIPDYTVCGDDLEALSFLYLLPHRPRKMLSHDPVLVYDIMLASATTASC